MRLVPNSTLSAASASLRALEPAGRGPAAQERDVDARHLGPRRTPGSRRPGRRTRRLGLAPGPGDDARRRPPPPGPRRTRRPSGCRRWSRRRPRRRRGTLVSSVSGSTGIQPSTVSPASTTTAGARCTGTPRNRSYGSSLAVGEQARPGGPGRAPGPASRDASRCPARRTLRAGPRRPPATGGIGTGRGMTSAISERSRHPRCVRRSCISSAVSLGAGGHLNGVDVTPTTTRPPVERRQHVAQGEGARPRCRTRGRPRPARAWRPGRGRRPSATTRTSASNVPASVSTRRAAGSMARTSACTNRTPGLDEVAVRVVHRRRRRPARTSRPASRTRRRSRRSGRSSTTSTVVAERVGQPCRQLQPTEPCAQHHHPHGAGL